MKKSYCVIYGKYRKFEKPKYHISQKSLVLSIVCSKCKNEDKKHLSKNNQLRY